MKFILAFLFSMMIFSVSPVYAQMGFGGGCIVLDELCEKEDYLHLKPVDIEPVMKQIDLIGADLKGFENFARELAVGKKWFLEDRAFNPELCSPQGPSSPPENFKIVACQSPLEVRISENYWNGASDLQKKNLVIHELMVAYFLKLQRPLALARSATYLLTESSYLGATVRDDLHELGLPFFSVEREVSIFAQFAKKEFKLICSSAPISEISQKAKIYISENLDLIAVLRKDYQDAFYSGLNQVVSEGRSQSYNCRNSQSLELSATWIYISLAEIL